MNPGPGSHQVGKRKHVEIEHPEEYDKQEIIVESKSNSILLQIPAEIRRQILRNLLFSAEPLREALGEASEHRNEQSGRTGKKMNAALYPTILRVCHQIHDEGSAILYNENTVDIQLKFDGDNLASLYVLGYDFLEESGTEAAASLAATKAVRERMTKWRIILEIEERHDLSDVRDLIRDCCMMLTDMPNVRNLMIWIQDRGLQEPTATVPRASEILRPFQVLRRLDHVEFIGLSNYDTTDLARQMSSSVEVMDLPNMFLALEDFVERFAPEDDIVEAAMVRVADVMDLHDEQRFGEHRQSVLHRVIQYVNNEGMRALRYDPTEVRVENLED